MAVAQDLEVRRNECRDDSSSCPTIATSISPLVQNRPPVVVMPYIQWTEKERQRKAQIEERQKENKMGG